MKLFTKICDRCDALDMDGVIAFVTGAISTYRYVRWSSCRRFCRVPASQKTRRRRSSRDSTASMSAHPIVECRRSRPSVRMRRRGERSGRLEKVVYQMFVWGLRWSWSARCCVSYLQGCSRAF